MMNVLFTCTVESTVSVPLEITNASSLVRLWISLVPDEYVIVIEAGNAGITASSPAAGSTPPTQLLAVLQSPPAPLPQVIVARSAFLEPFEC
jgi:hypothetical protein